ncbi:unnamed protein product [Tuber melanosporum]|uniref:(Perigord truffle) hypothetical protein n=1 Tax=Tuber melanosporum (strain Mel28) TaxID=656061 RepID=D5GLI3_TUBMM|nr:uncharacterized protein GSTUM_00010219001 [Tuber melanosporum]CAZ85376.1 unnamed protein product [Tuber melanosporum]
MVVDRRLDNILRILLQPGAADPNNADASSVYASAATVLATLTNPLNVSLLSTQILISPAIWEENFDGLKAGLRVFGVFQSATVGKFETQGSILSVEEWISALVRGANNNVPRWKHLLLLGGVLSADQERSQLPRVTRTSLEQAFCRAVNLSVESNARHELEADVLSLQKRLSTTMQALLPVIVKSMYNSREGFQSGYFLSTIDHDIMTIEGKLVWPSKSNSFLELQQRSGRPLFAAMSGLARLAAASIRHSQDPMVLHQFVDSLWGFSQVLSAQWKMNGLSEIPMSEEKNRVDEESLKATLPVVWQILKAILFGSTMILQELTARIAESPLLSGPDHGPTFSSKILLILRNFYFITSRLGPNAFSSYNFVYLSAIDILTTYPIPSEKFIIDIAPAQAGTIPPTLPERLFDLYFLNTVEHFTHSLPQKINEETTLPCTSVYLLPSSDASLHAHFESAHSVMLSIIGAPKSADLGARILPFYVDTVFKTFPASLSARQFRLAFGTLIRECSPPQAISSLQPHLAEVIMEILAERAKIASTEPLDNKVDEGAVGLSEKDVCILALIDGLPAMEVGVMERWLDPTADLLNSVGNEGSKGRIRERFWDVLSGELDVERAEVAVRWWTSANGRDKVLLGLGKGEGVEGIRAML